MNDNDPTNVPPPITASPNPVPPPWPNPKPFSWWLRKLLACNPFYLVSAALLLVGCYRVSIDAPFLNHESARLLFNFTSVQAYEILLVLTAIFLARRRLWYDSTLLVGLENLLVFVPFILISQAALMDSQMARTMCAAGAAAAILRFGGLKKYFSQLNLPGRLLGAGFILLSLNVALPLIYRHFGETKFGVHLDAGPAYEMNECTWLLILPAVLALANFLPRARATGNILPQHRWLPAGLFSLWIMVTCVHLWGLDYVYEFYLRSELFAPAAWVLAWTVFLRFPSRSVWPKYALTFPAALVPLLATSPGGTKTFLILTALNIASYGAISLLDRSNRLARHLVFASGLLLVAGLPDNWMQAIAPGFARAQCVASGLTAYLIFWTAWLRNPKLAILGSIILGSAIMSVFGHHAGAGHWALQSGFVFLLLHSLRWNDSEHPGASTARMLAGMAWVIQSFVWMNAATGRFWMPLIPGLMVLGIYCACQICRGQWNQFAVPAAALLVVLSGPCSATVDGVRATPVGLLAVIGSFLLFGFGTVAALTRHHWHKHEHELETESRQTTEGNR
jgi:hypothetical protein